MPLLSMKAIRIIPPFFLIIGKDIAQLISQITQHRRAEQLEIEKTKAIHD